MWQFQNECQPKASYLQYVNSLLGTQELFLIATASWNTFHLISILDLQMQTHLGVLWLIPIAVITLLFGADECMHCIQPPLPIFDHLGPTKLVLCIFHSDTTAMKAHTAQCLESGIEESVMVDWTGELNMTKVSRIRLVVKVTETRVVNSTVDGLSCHVSLLRGDKQVEWHELECWSIP